MTLTPTQRVVNALTDAGCGPRRNGKGWEARCPAHDDKKPSLSVGEGDEGQALLCCHAGCDVDAILAVLSLTRADLFERRNGAPDEEWTPRGPAVAVYDYVDEDGKLLFQVCRTADKQFPQRRPDPTSKSGWRWNLNGVRKVPYRLPQVIKAVADGVSVWVCEGEKDVHSLERAGAVATTNPGGADKAGRGVKWQAEWNRYFADAVVAIVADRDAPGRAHARHIARQLAGVAKSVELCEPIVGKDISDHLAAGHGLDELVPLAESDDDEPPDDPGPTRLLPGGEFLFGDTNEVDQPLVGSGSDVLHAGGEATFVIAITGVGKSTYAQNYILRRLGFDTTDFLGYPVTALDGGEVVLYVAADRPRQIRRSLRRMIDPDRRDELDRRLLVWKGPLPFLLNREPARLAAFVTSIEEDQAVVVRDVILDSLKDVAVELSKDEGGAMVAQAVNHLVAESREVLVLHHERKAERGAKKAPADIGDVYGSQFLTACAGNVIYLHGTPGGHILTLHHLKQSADQIGPLELEYDHDTGRLTAARRPDLLEALRGAPKGMTVRTACHFLFGDPDPDRNTMARAYRNLERLVKLGLAWREKTGDGFDQAALYYPGTRAEAP